MPNVSKGNSAPRSRTSFERTARCFVRCLLRGSFERELRESLLAAEAVVGRVLQGWYRKIEAIENATLRQRADDVLDLGRDFIRRLRGEQGAGFQAVPEGSIVVARRVTIRLLDVGGDKPLSYLAMTRDTSSLDSVRAIAPLSCSLFRRKESERVGDIKNP
jgi:phosphoenolpyruvate-protein kinase (PTS system EI component)